MLTWAAHPVGEAIRPESLSLDYVHGLSESHRIWQPFAEASGLANQNALELPWSGVSNRSWSTWANPESVLLDRWKRNSDTPFVAVAHSYGANLLLRLLSRTTVKNLKGVVLICPFYRPETSDITWSFLQKSFESVDSFVENRIALFGRTTPAALRATVHQRVKESIDPMGWVRFLEAYSQTPHLALGRVRCPTLVIAGAQDQSARPEDAGLLTKRIPGAQLKIIPDAGHFPMLETPKVLANHLDSFVHSIERPAQRRPIPHIC